MISFGGRLGLGIACMSEDGCTLYTSERCRRKTCAVAAHRRQVRGVGPCLLCFDFLWLRVFSLFFNLM